MKEKMKRGFDSLSPDEQTRIVQETIDYFQTEQEMTIGIIEAESILDFFLETLEASIYNKALENAKNTIKQEFEELEFKLDVLKK